MNNWLQHKFPNIFILLLLFCHISPNLIAQAEIDSIQYNNSLNIVHLKTARDSIYWKTNYWNQIKFDHRFFIVDSTNFSKNQILTLNTSCQRYMDFAMTLKFRPYSNLRIHQNTSATHQRIYTNKEGHLKKISNFNNYSIQLEPIFSFQKRNYDLFINQPALVKHVWKTIPEPHRLITDRKHLKRRTAKEGIEHLVDYRVNSPEKLDKIIDPEIPWKLGGVESIQFSQAYLSNWTKGGENTISLQSDLRLNANYTKLKNHKTEWESFIRHRIGIIQAENYPAQLNTDLIELNSKYGINASNKWYYSTIFNFKSQLFEGYKDKNKENIISSFLSPAYFTFALGMDFKKDKNFTLFLSPLTSKTTFVLDTAKVDQTRYKVPKNKKAAYNNGLSLVNTFNWKISAVLNLKSDLDAFFGYLSEGQITQIDWELVFDLRINQYLTTRINTQLRYFTNESKKLQLREYYSVNFNYKF
jgi:hypothetical protein